jgi:exodeoxyribonuclease VII small subunit
VSTNSQGKETGASVPEDAKLPTTFEDALRELEATVGTLESGDLTLQQTLGLYERGTVLLKHCHHWLATTEQRIELISRQADGSIATEAWEPGTPIPTGATRPTAPAPIEETSSNEAKVGRSEPDSDTNPDAVEGELPF